MVTANRLTLSVVRARLRRALYATFVVVLSLTAGARAGRYTDPPTSAYAAVGPRAERGYFSAMPWDQVDVVTGDLSSSFTDLVLPGNAGMDLSITRTYRHQAAGPQWSIVFTGAPVIARMPSGQAPSLVMADRSTRTLHTGVVAGFSITTDFWRFNTSTRTLYFPNGFVATYDAPDAADNAYLHEVHDAYGNTITPSWDTAHRIGSIAQTVDDSSGTRTRTVVFNYTSGYGLPDSMTFGSRTWTYSYESASPWRLTAAHPPEGPGWGFSYTSSAVTVTTPSGGTVAYSFQDQEGRPSVHQIATGGRAVNSGTWTISYARTGPSAMTTVATPGGRELSMRISSKTTVLTAWSGRCPRGPSSRHRAPCRRSG